MKKTLKFLVLALVLVFVGQSVFAQGVTTSSVRGKVVDLQGNPLSTANVVAVHLPSGTQYGTSTSEDGRFVLANVKIGGPYRIIASYLGYKAQEKTGIQLSLNQTLDIKFELTQSDQTIEEVVVSYDKSDVMNSDRTGAVTHVDSKSITALPSIARSQQDFTRMTPQSDGNSFGGRNSLYNNFSLDGSIFNNSFGLDYATPGGQADAQPVSLDAIEQIQVSIAPFDVREGGFTGAGINAVTKSGTNELKATVYHYFRNEAMIGTQIGETKIENVDFSTNQTGFSVGGPIIENKLFFFVNAEAERRDELAHGFVARDDASQTDPNVTSVLRSDIEAVQDHLINVWGYDPGAYEGYNHQAANDKVLAKLNWNISNKHNMSVRYSYLDAWKDILPHPEAVGGRGATTYRLPFENSSYRIFNKISSVVTEVNSRFSDKLSNKLMIGYTQFRDERQPKSVAAPVIDIYDANGNLAITAGSEMFSTSNILNQNVFQFNNNLSYFANKHTLTAGVNYEQFYFENSFNLFYYPWIEAASVNDFLADNITFFGGAIDPASVMGITAAQEAAANYAWSYVKVGQLGVYIQDEFQATDNLNLTFGLRVDAPIYLNEVTDGYEQAELDAVATATDFDGWLDQNGESVSMDPSAWPEANLLWAPRFGFNWDVNGDRTLQVRGGSGIFSGRIPFVWLGNQASNSRIDPGYEFQVNATTQDFKFPQVWKNNLAVDYKFGKGWLATFEGLYSKDINAVVHRNYNMTPPTAQLTGTGDDRAIFGTNDNNNIYSVASGFATFLEAGAIVLDNVDEGHQYTLTGQIRKDFDFGLSMNMAYTYLESKDYTSIPAEIAADAFQRNPVIGNPNDPMFSYSRYGLKNRVIGTLMYQKQFDRMASSFALFFEAGQGNRYSYSYVGDLNLDGISNNDLLYVPTGESDINLVDINNADGSVTTAAQQWTALDAFIEQDPYLSERRGDYAERNGVMLPWFSQVDFKFMQDFNIDVKGKQNTLRFSVDVLNIGNMLNSAWGVRQIATTWNPISVSSVDAAGVPYFTFNQNLTDSYTDDVSIASKWQLQIGIRYIFN